MKHLIYILFFLTLGFTACGRHTTYPPAMLQAEALMNTRPDSALTLLESIADTLAMLPEETRMYHQLLTIQAKDKLYITHTSDSLINRIVAFYEEYGNIDRLMMAYFYQGSTYRDMNDAPRALKAFQQAVDLNVPNLDLLAKTYNQMGTLFMYQGLHDEVIRVNQKSIETYLSQGKRNKISYAQRDIARMYDVKNMPDSALHYYKQACQTALMDGDSARYYGILSELGGYIFKKGDSEEGKRILKTTELNSKIQNKTHIYATLGYIYDKLNQEDSAYYYHNKVLIHGDIRNLYHAHRSLFNLEKKKKNYDQALKHIDAAFDLENSISVTIQTEAIAKINALYNYQHTQEEINRLSLSKERQKNNMLFLLLIFMSLASGCIIYFYEQKKKKQNELNVERLLRSIAEDKYETSKRYIQKNEEEIRVLNVQLREAKKNSLPLEKKEARIINFRQSPIYNEFIQAATNDSINMETTNNESKWKELEDAIDKTYPSFRNQLTLMCPHLSKKEMKVCLLTKVGISPSGIAIILKTSRQGITNIRSRIYKKIQDKGTEYSKINDFIEKI